MSDPGEAAQKNALAVSSRLIRLDPGLFTLSLMPIPSDRGTGLPAVRVSLPPGPAGRREGVTISTIRGDGWLTVNDEAILLRVHNAPAEVLVTSYWPAADASAGPPPLKLGRLNPEGAASAAPLPAGAVPRGSFSPAPAAEIVAHIQGVGDVDGKVGDWIGMRGSGRAIEGFSLAPRQGISSDDFEIRAVLGRDWLSPWIPGGNFCGSRGLALPLRGFCIRLHAAAAARVDLICFGRFVDGAESGPVPVDRLCASASFAALEAFQVTLRPRAA